MSFLNKWLRVSLAAALLLPCTPVFAADPLSDEAVQGRIELDKLNSIFDQYVAIMQQIDPEELTSMGIHSADMYLTSRSADKEKEKLDNLRVFLNRVRGLNRDKMRKSDLLDLELFETKLLLDIFNTEHLSPLKTRPQYYLSALDSIYGIMTKEFGSYFVRAENALRRLEQLPDVLIEAERNLYHPPRIWVDQTILECDEAEKSFSDLVPMFNRFIGVDTLQRRRLERAVDNARDAIKRYRNYLANDVMVQADGDFRVGEDVYGYYMERWHKVDDTPSIVLKRMRKIYAENKKECLLEMSRFLGAKDVRTSDFEYVLLKLGNEHPAAADVTRVFQQEIERSYQHFDRYRILPVPKERIRVVETPAYLRVRGVPSAYYNAPYPLDDNRVAELYVTTPLRKVKPQLAEAILQQNFNYASIEQLVTHEVMPGRHLQDSESAKVSRIRRIAKSPLLTNGWASYSQYLGLERGFFTSHAAKIVYLRWQLVRAARAIVDVQLHMKEITYEQAFDFLTRDAGLTRPHAKAELLRVSYAPTDAVSYLYGLEEMLRLRKKFEGIMQRRFDIRDFHAMALSVGNIPLPALEEELTARYKQMSETPVEDADSVFSRREELMK